MTTVTIAGSMASVVTKLFELSLFFEEDAVLIIERDSGVLFDLTESDAQVEGLSSFLLSGLMKGHEDKAYLVTTGYNRNMLRFPRERKETMTDVN